MLIKHRKKILEKYLNEYKKEHKDKGHKYLREELQTGERKMNVKDLLILHKSYRNQYKGIVEGDSRLGAALSSKILKKKKAKTVEIAR